MKSYEINKVIALDMMHLLKGKKKESLVGALRRNAILTSAYVLSDGTMRVYKEGFYLKLKGTRCGFAVFAKDNDGELEILERKPNEKNLSFLYEGWIQFNEGDYRDITEDDEGR